MSATGVRTSLPTSAESHGRQSQRYIYDFPKVPAPTYRHAAPSAPWPWMNFGVDASKDNPILPGLPDKSEWGHYPQSLFENWTHDQVNRSQMLTKYSDLETSTVYKIGVFDEGSFDKRVEARAIRKDNAMDLRAYWNHLGIPPPSNIRVQALFVEDMTLPVLQMLGTKYNVEPFFFASSANWIPSRYQEDPKALEDHITVVLPFIRTFKNQRPIARSKLMRTSTELQSRVVDVPLPYTEENQTIDTQAPLSLPGNKILYQDLLSLHMVRNTRTSTIISLHFSMQWQGTSAKRLQSLVQRTGNSVYWSNIFKRSKDPTFHFLAILWYALYAWDEAFEILFRYINAIEYDVLQFNNIKLTRELHKLQAYLLYYQQLLRDFLQSVEFVRDTPNPAMNAPSISKAEREDSEKLLRTEAHNLITEIKRLTQRREMLSDRLDNVIHLAFATVNIEESKAIQRLVEVTVRNSAAMKQIAYLSMLFLPATYLANVFSMNVQEINPPTTGTLVQYIVSAVGLTVFTSWLVIVFQKDSFFYPRDSDLLHRTLWPLFYAYAAISIKIKRWISPADHRSSPLPS